MWFFKFALVLSVTYAIIVAAIFFLQTWMIFPASLAKHGPDLPTDASYSILGADNGDKVTLVHIPPSRISAAPSPVLLGFGGNAWNADALAVMLHQIFPEYEIASLHYRGYGESDGSPSAKALFEDARHAFDRLEATSDAGVVVVGLSIGASVAVELAASRSVKGLVLITPFDSLKELAASHYPWLPVRLLIRHRMEAAETLRKLNVPTAIVTAENDTVVPSSRSEPVRMAANDLRADLTIKSAGHNDIYAKIELADALQYSVDAVLED